MAVRSFFSRYKVVPLNYQLIYSHIFAPSNPRTICFLHTLPVSSQFLYSRTFSTDSPSTPPELVHELSRILSDFRNPHHDIDSALNPFAPKITTNLVEQVLKMSKNLGFSAHRFFIWSQQLSGFRHSKLSYHILVDILGHSKQFPLLWDFLSEMKDTRPTEINPEIFYIVFRAYSRANLPLDAIRAFTKMEDLLGIKPSSDDLDKLLFPLCKRKHVSHAQQYFDKVKHEFSPTVKTYSILIRGWGLVGKAGEARKLFDEMLELGYTVDMPAYNSVLESLCKAGNVDEAYKLFRETKSIGLKPDAFTYSIFIHGACEANDLHSTFRILDRVRRDNLVPTVYTYNCIIKKLCKNDKVDEAYLLLDEMIEKGAKPNTWSYNTILAYHCEHNEVTKSLRLIARIQTDSCQPDRHTYNMVLKMLIRVGRFDRVTKVWESMEDTGFHPPVSTYAAMVHGFCKKKGKLEEACKYFEMMIDNGIPPYSETCDMLRNRLIGLGFSEETHILADKMERSTSCSIQELANVVRGNSSDARMRVDEGDYSDDSDSVENLRRSN